jgi:hypothetical protein
MPTAASAGEDVGHRGSHSSLREQKMVRPGGRQGVVSYKSKKTLTIWSNLRASWYLTKGVEKSCPHRNLPGMFAAALFKTDKTQ